jgi:cytochrome c-type biogenesis protein CcmH
MTRPTFSRTNAVILGACILAGAAGYALIGQPGMADQPMSSRQAALADKVANHPQDLTFAEALSHFEQLSVDEPTSPGPHFAIGELMRMRGRPDDALRSYQSALRRNPDFVPALVSLGDVLVELGGGAVSPDATRLFGRAYELDETQVRAGMFAAMGAAPRGLPAAARRMRSARRRGDAEGSGLSGALAVSLISEAQAS